MLHMCLLPAEQNSRVGAPIECHFAALRIADKRRRAVPGKRWSYSMEAARSLARGMIGVEICERDTGGS